MTYDINHYLQISSTANALFEAITTGKGVQDWWTECPIYEAKLGGDAHFIFKGNGFHNIMEVTAIENEKLVEWKVKQGDEQWVNTIIRFEIIPQESGVHLRFAHNQWRAQTDFLGHCTFQWGKYLMSLKKLLETGKGEPYTDY